MKYLKHISVAVSFSLVILFSGGAAMAAPTYSLAPSTTFAADSQSKQAACAGLSELDSSQNCQTQGSSVSKIVQQVVELLSIVIGVASVLVIMFAGFRYITSGGDSNTTNSARNMLIYAVIGIVVAVLAQFLAHSVLNTANNVKNGASIIHTEAKSDLTG